MNKSYKVLKNHVDRLADETSEICYNLTQIALSMFISGGEPKFDHSDPEQQELCDLYIEYKAFLEEFLEDSGIEVAVAIWIKDRLQFSIR